MSSTRSRFPKAPAIKRTAIIVSHGQPSNPDPAEESLSRFAAKVGQALPGWHIGTATLAKEGALDVAVERAGLGSLIYPLFMTSGWFAGVEILNRLRQRHAKLLPPLGLDPGLPGMTVDLLHSVLEKQGWQAKDTKLIVVAHGSGRSRNAARDTLAFASELARLIPFENMRVGFVEEPPYLTDIAFDLGAQAICLPFFAARGGHVIEDIPEALTLADFQGIRLDPIGCAPGVAPLVARTLEEAWVHE